MIRPCAHPGCRTLTRHGRCDRHRERVGVQVNQPPKPAIPRAKCDPWWRGLEAGKLRVTKARITPWRSQAAKDPDATLGPSPQEAS